MRLPPPEERGEMARRLASLLDAQQLESLTNPDFTGTQYDTYGNGQNVGWFDLTSNRGRRWRIWTHGLTSNLHLMRGPKGPESILSVCAHPSYGGYYGDEDFWAGWLAQYLALRWDEDMVIRHGNPQYAREVVMAEFDEEAFITSLMQRGYGRVTASDYVKTYRRQRLDLGIDT
jgi:hypothetical protein